MASIVSGNSYFIDQFEGLYDVPAALKQLPNTESFFITTFDGVYVM